MATKANVVATSEYLRRKDGNLSNKQVIYSIL